MIEFVRVVLIIVAIFALGNGCFSILFGTSAIHQILTGVYFLMFTLAAAGAGLILAVERATKAVIARA
jgi:hypothetical protein